MAEIRKPTTNPLTPALLNLFLPAGVGYLVLRQTKKGVLTLFFYLLSYCVCVGPILIAVVTAWDAYLLGEKLRRGEAIGEMENGVRWLDTIFKN